MAQFSKTSTISARSPSIFEYINPLQFMRSFWRNREIIRQFTYREIVGQYKESFLGMLWVLFTPLFMLLIYTFVFGVVFHRRWNGDPNSSLAEFALIIFCGFAVFNIFSETVNHAPRIITSMPNYVKKIVFPLEILPVSSLGSSIFHGLMRFAILIIANLIVNRTLHWTIVLLPLVLLPLILLTLSMSWLLASLGVFFRDLQQGVLLFVQALFFFSAILFPTSTVPAAFRPIIEANPITSVVENARLVVLWGQIPNWSSISLWTPVTAIFMIISYTWFMKTKSAFADVI